MKILWNILPTLGPRTGIGWYARETLSALRSSAGPEESYLESPGAIGRSVRLAWLRVRPWFRDQGARTSAAPDKVPGGIPSAHRTWKGWAVEQARHLQDSVQTRTLNRLFRRGIIDLYHEPNFLPWTSEVPTVSTFHDLSPILHPEWHPSDRVAKFESSVRQAVDHCCHFFSQSDAMCAELTRCLGVPAARITRTYNGVRSSLAPVVDDPLAAGMAAMGLKPGYFLHVGTLEPRKNLFTIAKAWADLPAETKSRHPLVLAGGWGWRCDDLRRLIESTPGIIRLGYAPEEHLAALYSGAKALLFPTLYEGFGMPVIEMLACGGGVIASRIPVLQEILGCHARFVDPLDVEGWRDAMKRVSSHPEWLDAPREGAEAHAARFTWKATAESTRAGYLKALGSKALRNAA